MAVSREVQGSYRDALLSLRDRLAEEIDAADARTLPALAKQLADVLARIEGLPEAAAASPVDEVAKKRAKRRKKASGE